MSPPITYDASTCPAGLIGPLPPTWSTTTVQESCEKPEYGYTETAEPEPVGPKFLRITDIQDGKVDWKGVPHCRCDERVARRLGLRQGDLLIARIGGTTGKSFFVRDCPKSIFASYLIRLRAKAVDPEFLYFFCQSEIYWRQILASKGEKLKGGVSGAALSQIIHPLPPAGEQRAIAGVLSKLQSAIESQNQIAATLKELKAATMAKLFRKGLRGEPVKLTAIGQMPETWKLVSIGDLFQIQLGKMLSQKARGRLAPRPYLRNANVQWGRFKLLDVYEMDFSPAEEKKFALRSGDLLVCEGGEVGRTALWRGEIDPCFYQKALHRLRPKNPDAVLPAYYLYWSEAAFTLFKTHGIEGTTTTIAHLPAVKLAAMEMPLPDLREQASIASILDSIDSRIRCSETRLSALQRLFSSTLKDVMTGCVRVQCEAEVLA